MKYWCKLFLSVLFSIGLVSSVDALSCPNNISKDLGQTASYVKADYEVIDNSISKTLKIGDNTKEYYTPNYDFEISIYNITDDIYVTVENDVDDEELTIFKSDTKDGVYTFSNDDFGVIYNYTITVMSSRSECYGEKVRTIKLIKPMYNAYSEYVYCQGSSGYYCQKFTKTKLNLNGSEDFLKRIKTNNLKNMPEEKSESENLTIVELFKKNWIMYVSALFVVVILVVTILIIVSKRKKRDKGWDL